MIKNHKKLLISVTILLVVCVALLVIADKQFTKPIESVGVSSPYPITKQVALNLIPKSYADDFVSFNYPTVMTINNTPKPSTPFIDNISLSYPDVQSWLLIIQVLSVPSGSLYNNSAYQARIINPTTYLLTQSNINGMTVPIFTDRTSTTYSRVAFLISDDYQATVSLTGYDSSGQTPLSNTLAMILDSFEWQNGY